MRREGSSPSQPGEAPGHGVDGRAMMSADGPLPADLLFDPSHVPGGLAIVAGRLLDLDRDLSMPALSHHLVWMHLTTADTRQAVTVQGRDDQAAGILETAPAGLTVLPAGGETHWHYHGLAEALCWLVPHEDMVAEADACGLAPDRVDLVGCVGEPNALVYALAWATLRECQRAEAAMQVYLETMRTAMIAEVVRVRASRPPIRTTESIGASRVRTAVDYLQANLASDPRLAAVAHAIGVSPHQLARGFRREMGMPLHRYVLRQRAAAGRSLLVRTDLPIAQVAGEAGFADQSHFTRWVRRFYGVTPSKLRAEADPQSGRR